MPAPHNNVSSYTSDEFAECVDGVPDLLYRKIWNEIVPLAEGQTGWDDFGPVDTRKNHFLVDHWDKFTEQEQGTINILVQGSFE